MVVARRMCSSLPKLFMTTRGADLKALAGTRGRTAAFCTSLIREYWWMRKVSVGPCAGGRGGVGWGAWEWRRVEQWECPPALSAAHARASACNAVLQAGAAAAALHCMQTQRRPAHPWRLAQLEVGGLLCGGEHQEVGDTQGASHGHKVLKDVALGLLQGRGAE